MPTVSNVGVDAGVAGGARQALPSSIGNVPSGVPDHIAVLLAQAKVDQVELVLVDASAHQKVLRLQVAVNVVAGVQILQSH